MKCPKCGFENNNGENFCSNCGFNLNNGNVSQNQKVEKKVKFKWWLPLVMLLIFLGFSVLGSFCKITLDNELLGDVFRKIGFFVELLLLPSIIYVIVEYIVKKK